MQCAEVIGCESQNGRMESAEFATGISQGIKDAFVSAYFEKQHPARIKSRSSPDVT